MQGSEKPAGSAFVPLIVRIHDLASGSLLFVPMEIQIKRALKGQYHAGLAMLRQTLEVCPEDLWLQGEHPRNFWRIAYHALFYTHLYLQTEESAFQGWEKHDPTVPDLWEDAEPPVVPAYCKKDLLGYLDWIDVRVDGWVDALDLASAESGFNWYKIPKLDHQLVNIRHLGIHQGQLSELVFAKGCDVDWVGYRER